MLIEVNKAVANYIGENIKTASDHSSIREVIEGVFEKHDMGYAIEEIDVRGSDVYLALYSYAYQEGISLKLLNEVAKASKLRLIEFKQFNHDLCIVFKK